MPQNSMNSSHTESEFSAFMCNGLMVSTMLSATHLDRHTLYEVFVGTMLHMTWLGLTGHNHVAISTAAHESQQFCLLVCYHTS